MTCGHTDLKFHYMMFCYFSVMDSVCHLQLIRNYLLPIIWKLTVYDSKMNVRMPIRLFHRRNNISLYLLNEGYYLSAQMLLHATLS